MPTGSSFLSVCARARRLLRCPDAAYRRSVLVDYLRSELRPYRASSMEVPGEQQLLGYRVAYYDVTSYLTLLREIFVADMYRFGSPTPAPVIFDCGSNIGMSVLYFKHLYPSSRIVGFEPDPRTFAMLKRNVENNSLTSVELHNVALGSHDGETEFYYCQDRPGWVAGSTLKGYSADSVAKVPVRRLSPMVTGEVDLLKLDIEGSEHDVLNDLAASGKLPLIRQIILEYHHHMTADDDRLGGFLSLLEAHGFGYAIASDLLTPFEARSPQELVMYAYRKNAADAHTLRG